MIEFLVNHYVAVMIICAILIVGLIYLLIKIVIEEKDEADYFNPDYEIPEEKEKCNHECCNNKEESVKESISEKEEEGETDQEEIVITPVSIKEEVEEKTEISEEVKGNTVDTEIIDEIEAIAESIESISISDNQEIILEEIAQPVETLNEDIPTDNNNNQNNKIEGVNITKKEDYTNEENL